MKKNHFLSNENGDTNFVAIVMFLAVIILFVTLFYPYIASAVKQFFALAA